MDNGMIRKFAKAKQYAEEKDRIKFKEFVVQFEGKNNPHTVHYSEGSWQCDCDYFIGRGRCSHTIALELILENMIEQTEDETN